MLIGNEIQEYLHNSLGDFQSGKSSHWQEHLDAFSFDPNKGFDGLKGFGGITGGNYKHRLYNYIMQLPYRVRAQFYNGYRSVLKKAEKNSRSQGRLLDLDILRQVITLAFIQEKIPEFNNESRLCVVIGDGFGGLSSLLLNDTNHRVVSVNLNEVLLVDYIYTRGVIGDENTALIRTEEDIDTVLSDENKRLIYIQADNHSLLQNMPIFIAFNIASMQEMNPPIVAQYFHDLRNSINKFLYFYCCNRIEKTLPDGTISSFFGYPWSTKDQMIIDELCPWHQRYYTTRFPFYHKYDGPTQHRLVKFCNR